MAQGLWGASKAFIAASLYRERKRPVLVVCPEVEDAEAFWRALKTFLGQESVLYLPPLPGGEKPSLPTRAERILSLSDLLQGKAPILVSPLACLFDLLPSPESLRFSFISLYPQRLLPLAHLVASLLERGYRETPQVTEWGEFSRRGGVLDLFSPAAEHPVRVEFFGDEIVSLRQFDQETQRSISPIEQANIPPLEEGWGGEGPDPAANLLQYFPHPPLVLLDEPDSLQRVAAELQGQGGGPTPPAWEDLIQGSPRLSLTSFQFPQPPPGIDRTISFETIGIPAFRSKISFLAEAVSGWHREGYRLRLFCKSLGQARRLQEALKEYELHLPLGEEFFSAPPLAILVGNLSSGFRLPELKLVVISEEEVFGGRLHEAPQPHRPPQGAYLPLESLKYGDFVVHVDHGIGLYRGLKRIIAGGIESEYLEIKYAGADKLYVPLDKLNLVHRYVGADAAPPPLDRLGGNTWLRAKEKAKAATKKIAKELLDLYAARQLAEGFPFPSDAPWQAEFEAAFPHEETKDQLQAIHEVKRDMENPRPMDRLVCGDVGYGKTEVAMRAAFKACMEGKQVAVLVPTTILALQHYQTFSERFSPFPLRVEMLSRFRTPAEQAKVLRGLANGEVDLVIGTHRLLQKDVEFSQLGLLIVDEEHRFGVTDKERIKQLRKEVDCLTLTATPIPRTLHMALVGLRDLSVINTPPEERLSIKTYLTGFRSEVIKEAIGRELDRQGQVFFVHNRVQSIQRIQRYLQRLLPSARIALAHGQMPEEELEQIMYEFYARKHDILLSTTIVESGLDLPNVNTILIHHADRLGLAQLYQLRGRVGRNRHQAYAYLLVPDASLRSRESRERLQAISELSELGSGYKLAMRDLQIRGAGNLLGSQQHGHVAAVGFELCCQLLEGTIRELKGEQVEAAPEPSIRLKVEGHFPEAYVPDPDQRFILYKRLLALGRGEELADLQGEIEDRCGPMPLPARRLFQVAQIRLLARPLRIHEIEAKKGRVRLTFGERPPIDPSRVMRLLSENKGALHYLPENILELRLPGDDPQERLEAVKNLLQGLS